MVYPSFKPKRSLGFETLGGAFFNLNFEAIRKVFAREFGSDMIVLR
jgi:hypothetical protein